MIKGGQTYYYHADGLGSIIAITDSLGRVVQKYEYDSFGNITYIQDTSFVQPYTYTGREYDEETGLHYYRARYYDAKVGRFITEDPIGLLGGINKFVYVGNNPVNFKDPLGLYYLCPNFISPSYSYNKDKGGWTPYTIICTCYYNTGVSFGTCTFTCYYAKCDCVIISRYGKFRKTYNNYSFTFNDPTKQCCDNKTDSNSGVQW